MPTTCIISAGHCRRQARAGAFTWIAFLVLLEKLKQNRLSAPIQGTRIGAAGLAFPPPQAPGGRRVWAPGYPLGGVDVSRATQG